VKINDLKQMLNKIFAILLLINILITTSVYSQVKESSNKVTSQGFKGVVKDEAGKPVAFVVVFVQELAKGTTTNINGCYSFKLPAGNYNVIIKHLSYKTQTKKVEIFADKFITIDIILNPQSFRIPDIRVTAKREDPAYYIMRKAMAMSRYYLHQFSSYDCRVYLKGTAFFNNIPFLLKKTLRKEGLEEGKSYTLENITDIHYDILNGIRKKVVAMKSSFKNSDVEPMDYITLSLYNEMKTPISPLDKRAFSVYKFRLENTFSDQGRGINKIKVIPRRKGYDLFSGYIYIADDYWNIHSVDLLLEQKMFSVIIKQLYAPVKKDVWMPISFNFDANVGVMGVKLDYKYVASVDYKNINLNKDIDNTIMAQIRNRIIKSKKEDESVRKIISEKQNASKKAVNKIIEKQDLKNRDVRKLKRIMERDAKSSAKLRPLEIKENYKILDNAKNRSLTFWDSIRPVTLTKSEKNSYHNNDSIAVLMNNPHYKDSVKKAKNRFRFRHIIFGNTYIYDDADAKFYTSALLGFNSFSYNTVEGLLFKKQFSFQKKYKNGKNISIRQNFSYSTERNKLLSSGVFSYRYNSMKRAYINVSGGMKTSDFNGSNSMLPSVNMITTLMLKQNYVKLYEKDFIKLEHKFDIVNGLTLTTGVEYDYRKQLKNNTDFYFTNPFDTTFTSNIPDNDFVNANAFATQSTFIFDAKIKYTPRYFYRVKDNVKRMLYSKHPQFTFEYKQGINNFFNSNSSFQFVQASIYQYKRIGFIGYLRYNVSTGLFFNKTDMHFADYKNFQVHPSFISANSNFTAFRLLNYYSHNTNDYFVQANVKFDNDRILIKRLPIMNKSLIRENIYFNYLKTSDNKDYFEMGYGLNQIFLLFNVEIFTGFEEWKHKFTGVKIVFPILSGGTTINAG
ncbi:MAG: carboxypeptidase-like regulatory domain-containing protein, partial [Bacteroidales bacterium]|nr:carboxypeptidase-like regulatory domain-containing protein [Bacteroidales bacterium]